MTMRRISQFYCVTSTLQEWGRLIAWTIVQADSLHHSCCVLTKYLSLSLTFEYACCFSDQEYSSVNDRLKSRVGSLMNKRGLRGVMTDSHAMTCVWG